MTTNYKNLLTPFTFPISGINVPNRVVLAPMTTFSGNNDGTTNDAEVAYYQNRNESAGLLITACAYIEKQGKSFPKSALVAVLHPRMLKGSLKLEFS